MTDSTTTNQLSFYGLPPFARHYKKPLFPMLPWQFKTASADTDTQPVSIRSRFLDDDAISFHKGRYALAAAFNIAANGTTKRRVLIPSYHCPSMVEPALLCGLTPVFYSVTDQLQPDVKQLTALIDDDCAAVLLVHFFGMVQDFSAAVELAHKHGCYAIEDCAHALGSSSDGMTPGTQGDLAIASTAKFFPGGHGGRLVINTSLKPASSSPITTPTPQRSGVKQELQDIKTLLTKPELYPLDEADAAKITASVNDLNLPEDLLQPVKAITSAQLEWCNVPESQRANSSTLNWLIQRTPLEAIATRRRQHYARLAEVVNARTDMHIFPEEMATAPSLPYVLPVLLDNPERQFPWLKLARAPVWRWEEIADSDCEVSQKLKNSLIQLPCHQAMSDEQVSWLESTLKAMPRW